MNIAIDLAKFIMAVLVIGIHTEPFGYNFWLDKGFGIITRLCVPFFFVASSYFFYIKEGKSALKYVKRLGQLLVVWSLIYLPLDFDYLYDKSFGQIIYYYLWDGPGHALWYLSASIIGFLIIHPLSRRFSEKTLLIIGFIVLLIGCVKTTYSPLMVQVFHVQPSNILDCRNGLFYAFPYMALGLFLARGSHWGESKCLFWFAVWGVILIIESFFFVYVLKTENTILWISVLPMSFFLYLFLLKAIIISSASVGLYLRKMSTLMFVSHNLFRFFLMKYCENIPLFFLVTLMSIVFSYLVICISRKKYFGLLKYLY